MKYFTGTIVLFVVLSIATYLVLQIWDINLIDPENFNKAMVTLGIVFILSVLLNILTPFFFKNHAAGYDQQSGNVAQPKK